MDSHLDFQSPFLTPAATTDTGDSPASASSSSSSSAFPAFGYGSPAAAVAAPVASSPASSSSPAVSAAPATTYDSYSEMFPSLPTSTRAPQPAFVPAPISFSSKIREHTERFQIEPPQLRPSGFGDKSHNEIIKAIMLESGTKIECSTARNGTMTVLITGKAEKAAVAKKKLLSALSKQYEVKIEVAREHLSALIGKGGSKLKALQEKSGARINVPKADDPSEFVTVSGDKGAVEIARLEIMDFLKEKTNFVRENLNIEPTYQPFVYGPGHENLKNIAQETGIKVHIPFYEAEDQTVVLSGPREGVAEASKRIQALYVEKKRTTKSIEVKVNKKQHRFVIGQKGANIQEILKTTGCNVTVPPADDPSDTIKVSGDDSKLLLALQLVLEQANSVCLEEINIDGAQLQRYVKSKGRNQIKELEKGTKALISFMPTSIDVQGPKEEVEPVRSKIIALLSEMKKLKFDEIDVAPELRKFVIGKDGKAIKKIKTDHNVDVIVPQEDEEKQSVFLAGEKDKVKIVKDQLQKTLKELANLTVLEIKVDPRFHKTIVGKKGETVKKLNDEYENCSIKVPKEDENSDLVVVRGPKEEAETLRKVIVKLVEDTRHHEFIHSFKVEVQVDKKAIKYIVGKAGAFINKLREVHDVKIEIESSKSEEEAAPAAPAAQAKKEDPKKVDAKKADGKGKQKDEEPKKEEKKVERPKARESETEKVVITGVQKNVEAARDALVAKAKEYTEGGGLVTVELNIEQKYHGNLIGSQGKFVKSLMDRHSITVRFPRGDAPSDVVVLSGMKKSVEKAQEELMELLEYEKSIGFVQHITADNAVLKQIMGVGSASKVKLLQIMDATRTQIDFENNDKESNKIVIKGTAQAAAEAKKLVEKYISDVANSVTEEIEIETQYHGAIIGTKGSRIRELSEKFGGVDIRFPTDKASKVIRLSGSRKNVEGVKAAILEIVKSSDDDKSSQITKDWELASKYYPGLRDYLKNNGNEIKVRVTFPKEGDILVLKGKEADIDAAIARFQENLEETLTIQVPRNLHRAMLGGGKIKDLNVTLGVVIRFPDRDSTSTNIVIRGKASALPAAEKALQELAEEAKGKQEERVASREPSDRASEVLKVNPEYVGRVIGRGGSNIRKIQELSGVKIDIKKDSGEIVVSGTKEAIQFALKELKDTIAEIDSRTTQVINVDPKYHSRLVGNRFANIFQIQDDFDVTVKVPKGSDEITVTGNKDDVTAAINYIRESVKDIEFDMKNEVSREERPRREEPREQQQPRANGSSSRIQANDPFFAPPPSQAPVDRTSVWGARMS